MKTLKQLVLMSLRFYVFVFALFPLVVFANGGHASGEEHNNDVAAIDPFYAVAFVGVAAVIGFLVWRFLLKK